jgi:hypothetical protein
MRHIPDIQQLTTILAVLNFGEPKILEVKSPMGWRRTQPISLIDAELIQNLKPEGGGPSGNTCPR